MAPRSIRAVGWSGASVIHGDPAVRFCYGSETVDRVGPTGYSTDRCLTWAHSEKRSDGVSPPVYRRVGADESDRGVFLIVRSEKDWVPTSSDSSSGSGTS